MVQRLWCIDDAEVVVQQRCRGAEVQRFRVGAGAAGKKVVWLYKGAKEVQSRCRGCAEAVQRCRGSAEAVHHR